MVDTVTSGPVISQQHQHLIQFTHYLELILSLDYLSSMSLFPLFQNSLSGW